MAPAKKTTAKKGVKADEADKAAEMMQVDEGNEMGEGENVPEKTAKGRAGKNVKHQEEKTGKGEEKQQSGKRKAGHMQESEGESEKEGTKAPPMARGKGRGKAKANEDEPGMGLPVSETHHVEKSKTRKMPTPAAKTEGSSHGAASTKKKGNKKESEKEHEVRRKEESKGEMDLQNMMSDEEEGDERPASQKRESHKKRGAVIDSGEEDVKPKSAKRVLDDKKLKTQAVKSVIGMEPAGSTTRDHLVYLVTWEKDDATGYVSSKALRDHHMQEHILAFYENKAIASPGDC